MWIKHNKVLYGKALILLVILLLGGTTVFGCLPGGQPEGWSGGIIANGTLFVGSNEGKLVALNKSDGSRLWEVALETARTAGGFGCSPEFALAPIYGTPVVDGDLIYVCGYNGKIYAVSWSKRAREWKYPGGEDDFLQPIVGGQVVSGGRVYFGCSDGKVYALDAGSGGWEWEFQTGDKIWSTPAIDGGTLYIGSFDKKLYALDIITGGEKWSEPFETEGTITSTPLVHDGTVYIGSFDRHIYAIDATDGQQIWQFPVEDGAENKPGNWFWAKPVVYNNTIYAGNLDGKVYILNAGTGNEVADAIDLGSPVTSSPVLGGNSIVVATEEGVIYAIDTATNEKRRLVDLEEKVYAPLFASDGVVYVHTDEDGLYMVEVQSGAVQEFNIR
ncbi:Serine/threonine-protein kinase AfsK [subsurface metagenome]